MKSEVTGGTGSVSMPKKKSNALKNKGVESMEFSDMRKGSKQRLENKARAMNSNQPQQIVIGKGYMREDLEVDWKTGPKKKPQMIAPEVRPGPPKPIDQMTTQEAIASGLLKPPKVPFYELAPAEQARLRARMSVYRMCVCFGITIALCCCMGAWYFLKFRDDGGDEDKPFEPYQDIINPSTTVDASLTTSTSSTTEPPSMCVGAYCDSNAVCLNFDTKLWGDVAARQSLTSPSPLSIDQVTICMNATFAGVPQTVIEQNPFCTSHQFTCTSLGVLQQKLSDALSAQQLDPIHKNCGCKLCQWPVPYAASKAGKEFCEMSKLRELVEGTPCGSVCGQSWPNVTTTTTSSPKPTTFTTTTTTTIDDTICVDPDYNVNTGHLCPMCQDYHSKVIHKMAQSVLAKSSDIISCFYNVHRLALEANWGSWVVQPEVGPATQMMCSPQILCTAFEQMVVAFREAPEFSETTLLGNPSNTTVMCACELCAWPFSWLSDGPGRYACLNAPNIVEGLACGPTCGQVFPIDDPDPGQWMGIVTTTTTSTTTLEIIYVDPGNDTNDTEAIRILLVREEELALSQQQAGNDYRTRAFRTLSSQEESFSQPGNQKELIAQADQPWADTLYDVSRFLSTAQQGGGIFGAHEVQNIFNKHATIHVDSQSAESINHWGSNLEAHSTENEKANTEYRVEDRRNLEVEKPEESLEIENPEITDRHQHSPRQSTALLTGAMEITRFLQENSRASSEQSRRNLEGHGNANADHNVKTANIEPEDIFIKNTYNPSDDTVQVISLSQVEAMQNKLVDPISGLLPRAKLEMIKEIKRGMSRGMARNDDFVDLPLGNVPPR